MMAFLVQQRPQSPYRERQRIGQNGARVISDPQLLLGSMESAARDRMIRFHLTTRITSAGAKNESCSQRRRARWATTGIRDTNLLAMEGTTERTLSEHVLEYDRGMMTDRQGG
jgi:hypothetical protein